jgi:hypothetical protein
MAGTAASAIATATNPPNIRQTRIRALLCDVSQHQIRLTQTATIAMALFAREL